MFSMQCKTNITVEENKERMNITSFTYIYIYMYVCVCVCVCISICMYIKTLTFHLYFLTFSNIKAYKVIIYVYICGTYMYICGIYIYI